MHRQRIYVDTSVIGGCFDTEFAEASWAVIDMAKSGKMVILISDILLAELENARDRVRAVLANLSREETYDAATTDEAIFLWRSYLNAGVVSDTSKNDALHVAIATVHKADVIVSWNFKHFVNVDRIRRFNAVNLTLGYQTIDIRSPDEVRSYED